MGKIVAIANQKGGVGKTTTCINLAASMAATKRKVLVIDLDPQGNASTGLGIDNRGLETSMYHVIMHEVPLENCIEPTSVKNLFVAPASLDLAGAEIELVPAFSRENRLRRAIEGVLDDFGVKGQIVKVRPGPVVTLYELEPAPGIKSLMAGLRARLKICWSKQSNAQAMEACIITVDSAAA